MKFPLILICTIILLQIPSYATSGIFGDDKKIEELNKKIDALEKENIDKSGIIDYLKTELNNLNKKVEKLNDNLKDTNRELTLTRFEFGKIPKHINVEPIINVTSDKYIVITASSGLYGFSFKSIKKYGSGSEIKASLTNLCSVTQEGIDINIEFLNDEFDIIYTAYNNIKNLYGGFVDNNINFRVPGVPPEKLNMARIKIDVKGMQAIIAPQ